MVLAENEEAVRYYEKRGWVTMNPHVHTYAKNIA
jgi:hypothetical protein